MLNDPNKRKSLHTPVTFYVKDAVDSYETVQARGDHEDAKKKLPTTWAELTAKQQTCFLDNFSDAVIYLLEQIDLEEAACEAFNFMVEEEE